MEIERLVSGDLNKSIEQCVNLLVDVERKVHALKGELAQTLHQLPGTPAIATPQVSAYTGSYGYPSPGQQGFPAVQQGFTPAPPQFYGAMAPAFVQAPIHQLPWNTVQNTLPAWTTPYGVPSIRDTPRFPGVSPYQGFPAFGAIPQGFGHGPVQNFGYIW